MSEQQKKSQKIPEGGGQNSLSGQDKGGGYLREIEIKFKKKRVKSGVAVNQPINRPQQVYKLFQDLQTETKEKLISISLDAKLKILCFEVVAIGSVQAIYGRPFEALRASLPLNPAGIIVVHNHPSGDPTPSEKDKEFTRNLKTLTDAAGLKFYDHIIIGDEQYFSFAEAGLLG